MSYREQGREQRSRLRLADVVPLPAEEPDKKRTVRGLSALDVRLPDPTPIEQVSPPLPVPVEPAKEVVVSTAKFDRLTDKALDTLDECLDEHNDDQDHLRLMNLKMQAAQTIISSRIKVDDTLLRRQQYDILPKIMELMAQEEENLRQIEAEAE